MPSYDYICTACGHEFELFQRMSDPPERQCPRCGGRVRRKIGSGAGILFKGSGFYATDYRSPEYKAKERAEKGSASSASGKGADSSEGKAPAEKKAAGGGTNPAVS
jgi:putative FmdB family regulatory protein